jgi:mRNA interferase MazF
VLVEARFIDSYESKMRPAYVLFEAYDNVVLAAITTNLNMDGVLLRKQEGAAEDSMIKTNYIFTVDREDIVKIFFTVSELKKAEVCADLTKRMDCRG